MNKHNIMMAIVALFTLGTSAVSAQKQLTANELNSLYTTSPGSVVSIHDPSVVYRNGVYYVWGSHLGVARSNDLVTWTGLRADGNTFVRLPSQGASSGTPCGFWDAFNIQQATKIKNYKGEMVNFPNFDGEAYCSRYAADRNTWINGDMWAPDIVYNEHMKKWCMYLSLNGDHWSSIIILLTSTSATGPFTYQGPVVMGGFDGQSRGGVAAPKIGETDYTIATGETTIPSRYIRSDNGSYWPNCIDPCVFFDEEGELWMSYGSWSGGIFMLKLDKETGFRDYTYTYPSDYASAGVNGVSDPYFGKKIAGGGYASGEGSYIQHIGDYYYLFMSYGGFAPDGGYEMRIFRSQNPDGPYVDGVGTKATNGGYIMNYGPNARTNMGMKLMGSYNNWGNQNVGECAQGHNSACTDKEGRSYVVYHTKFNDGTAGHQVRVHQLFVNEKGWLVAAPFIYAGETTTDADIAAGCPWSKSQLAGTYHVLLHPYKMDHLRYQESTPMDVTLTADGKVTGDNGTGTWGIKEGTAYMNIKIGATVYYGVFCPQQVNGATRSNMQRTSLRAIAFTALSNNGVSIWGYKLEDDYALAYNFKGNTIGVKEGMVVSSNLDLLYPMSENTTLTWTSSRPDIISETGKYNPAGLEVAEPVTLTARMECGMSFWEQSYNVKAQKEIIPSGDYFGGLVAYYDFNSSPCYNAYNTEQRTLFGTTGTKPVLVEDYSRFGKVLHQSFGPQGSNSYTKMTNPLLNAENLEGMTISMWVKRTDNNRYDALWGFFSGVTANASGARFFLTGNTYLGYNDNAGSWFDINNPAADSLNTNIPVGKWTLVTVTVGATNGVSTYINGVKKAPKVVASSTGGTTAKTVQYDELLAKVATLKYLYLGLGSFWGSADVYIDDLMVYNRELTSTDVRALNSMSNRVFDFTRGEGGTAVDGVAADSQPQLGSKGIFDLSGRRYSSTEALPHGIYVIDGRKVVK